MLCSCQAKSVYLCEYILVELTHFSMCLDGSLFLPNSFVFSRRFPLNLIICDPILPRAGVFLLVLVVGSLSSLVFRRNSSNALSFLALSCLRECLVCLSFHLESPLLLLLSLASLSSSERLPHFGQYLTLPRFCAGG